MSDREEHQQPAQDSRPKKAIKKKGAAAKKAAEPSGPSPPTNQRRPAKLDFQQKQVVDYVRTATRNNVWYYRDRCQSLSTANAAAIGICFTLLSECLLLLKYTLDLHRMNVARGPCTLPVLKECW